MAASYHKNKRTAFLLTSSVALAITMGCGQVRHDADSCNSDALYSLIRKVDSSMTTQEIAGVLSHFSSYLGEYDRCSISSKKTVGARSQESEFVEYGFSNEVIVVLFEMASNAPAGRLEMVWVDMWKMSQMCPALHQASISSVDRIRSSASPYTCWTNSSSGEVVDDYELGWQFYMRIACRGTVVVAIAASGSNGP